MSPRTDARSLACDVAVVGGGPAGLSAALVLARACRRVVLFDHGRYRNAASRSVHGYLTRDGVEPADLVRLGREEVVRYGVEVLAEEVIGGRRSPDGGFDLHSRKTSVSARKVLLATGVRDRLPTLDGLHDLYGISVHHCPYCDAWEWRDRRLAVHGRGHGAAELAHALVTWSRDVVLLSDGGARLRDVERDELGARGIVVIERRIARLEGESGLLQRVVFTHGEPLERDALFLAIPNDAWSDLGRALGCRMRANGSLWTDLRERSSLPGLFVAGDSSRDVQFVVVAAAEGAKAAVAINKELQAEDRRRELEEQGATSIEPRFLSRSS